MLKKGLSLLLAVLLLFSLSGCSDLTGPTFLFFLVAAGDDRADKDDIFDFVRENEGELIKAIEEGNLSAFENQGFIKDIDEKAKYNSVEFSCGGVGLGSGTSYVGFYYTPNHNMTAPWCAPLKDSSLSPSGDGFEWQESNGDNRYYTEHICGNFYYYEASF